MKHIITILFLMLSTVAFSQITVNTPFRVNSNNPIDTRLNITNLSDTTSLSFKYAGLITYVTSTDQFYYFDGTKWKLFEQGGSSVGFIYTIDSTAQAVGLGIYSLSTNNRLGLPSGTLYSANSTLYNNDTQAAAVLDTNDVYFLSVANDYALTPGIGRALYPTQTYGSDNEAILNGVDFGDVYALSASNIYGLPTNTAKEVRYLREREFDKIPLDVAIDTITTLADTTTLDREVGKLLYVTSIGQYYHVDKDSNFQRLVLVYNDPSGNPLADGTQVATPTYVQNEIAAGSVTSRDTTVKSDFTVSTANHWNITSFCISGVDNTISLPEPADSIRGNVIAVTHFDTSANQSRTTTVQTNFTDFDIYNNLTGDTLNFLNITQDRETAVFTLSEIKGVLRWVYTPKYRTRIIIAVDSIQQIPSLNVNLGDRIKVKSTGAEYLIEPDQLTTPDNLFTISVSGFFANIQKSNNVFNLSHIGQDTLTQIGKKAFSLFDNILMPSDTIWMDTLTIQNPISISGTSESVLSALNVTGVEGDFIRFNSDNVQLSGVTVTTDTFNLMSRALYFNDIKNVNLTNLNVIGSRGVDTTMLAKGFRSLIWLESCENVLIDNVYTANANTNWGILGKTDGSNISILNSTVRNTYRGGFAFVDGPFNNVLIDNFEADSCNLLFDLDAAVDIYGVTSGTELNKNIIIKNGVITNTGQKGCSVCWDLRIKTTDGGTVENVKITGGVATDSTMSGMLLIQERIGLGNRNIQLVNNTFEFNGLDYGLRPIRVEDVENITFERNTYTFTDQANLPSTDIVSLRSNIGDDGGVIRFIGENFDAGSYAGRFVITDNASPSNDWKSIIFSNNQIVSSGTPIQLTYTDRVLIEANFIQNKSNGNAFLTNFADTVEYYSNIFRTTDAEPAILNGLAFSGIDRSSANLKIRVSDGLTIQGDVINDKLNSNYTFTPFAYTALDTIPVDTLLSERLVITGALESKTITGVEYTLDSQVTTRSTLVRLLKYTPSTNTYTPFGNASLTVGNSFVTNTPSESISQGDIIYCETTQTGDNITGLTVTLKIE